MKHCELVELGYKWVLNNSPRCGVAFKEFKTIGWEIPDVIGFGSFMSIVVECKTSRSDFLADKKKPHRIVGKGMGRFRFFLCPEGLIRPDELPERWGLLYVIKGRAKCVHNPYNEKGGNIWTNGFERDVESENQLMYSALRRLHLRGLINEIYTPLISTPSA